MRTHTNRTLLPAPQELSTREVQAADGKMPYKLQAEPPRKLKNLQGIPIVYVTAERSGRRGEPVIAFLKQAGCHAEHLPLQEKSILGNGHFMMLETNRKQVFDVIPEAQYEIAAVVGDRAFPATTDPRTVELDLAARSIAVAQRLGFYFAAVTWSISDAESLPIRVNPAPEEYEVRYAWREVSDALCEALLQ